MAGAALDQGGLTRLSTDRAGAGQQADGERRGGPAEQVALAQRGPEARDHTRLIGVLDHLGDRGDAEIARQCCHGADETLAAAAGCHRAHVGAIELHLIDVEGTQIGEIGLARPEVIEANRVTVALQQAERLAHLLEARDARGFGEIEEDVGTDPPVRAQELAQHRHEQRALERARRKVDGDLGVLAGFGAFDQQVDDPLTDHQVKILDHADLLGEGHELERRAAARHAGERLVVVDRPAPQIDHRLKHRLDVARSHRAAEARRCA